MSWQSSDVWALFEMLLDDWVSRQKVLAEANADFSIVYRLTGQIPEHLNDALTTSCHLVLSKASTKTREKVRFDRTRPVFWNENLVHACFHCSLKTLKKPLSAGCTI